MKVTLEFNELRLRYYTETLQQDPTILLNLQINGKMDQNHNFKDGRMN